MALQLAARCRCSAARFAGHRKLSMTGRALGMRCGLVGLPNVGKSTLFNALVAESKARAATGNFPFCTVEPNVGVATVPDPLLARLAAMEGSVRTVPSTVQVVDIAGLVAGAAQGKGLGNKFLQDIRQVDAIVQVVACFREATGVTHVFGGVNPVRDIETIAFELAMADLDRVERTLSKKNKAKLSQEEADAISKVQPTLVEAQPVWTVMASLLPAEQLALQKLDLLSAKPMMYVCNVDEADLEDCERNEHVRAVRSVAAAQGAGVAVVCAELESKLAGLDEADRNELLECVGLEKSGCDNLVTQLYRLLDLQTFYTAGPKESAAWTVRRGSTAQQAASVIHTEIGKKLIKAETIAASVLLECGSAAAAKRAGKYRMEGKEYVVQEEDVFLFHHNA